MRRGVSLGCALVAMLVLAPPAAAATQTARSGDLTATFTFHGSFPNYSGERLTISRAGKVYYDDRVTSAFCQPCAPGTTRPRRSSLHAVDLEHTGQPDVVLDLFSGGAHCCTIEQIFSFDPATATYIETERNFGDPGVRIVDLAHNGRFELLTADDSFAYTFTDFAASGLPIEIVTFSQLRFVDVTRHYPSRVARDGAFWLKTYKRLLRQRVPDTVGVIAAWAADQDLLGHPKRVARYLAQQAAVGHLKSGLYPRQSGKKFIAKLQRFLRRRGYLR